MTTRTTLAVPVDVIRAFDQTISNTQLASDSVVNIPDNIDLLESYIEDAEDEFRELTDTDMRVARVGVAGQRETYENVSYDLDGHQTYKANWTGVTSDYLPTQVETNLKNDRILPFDPSQGDELYFYAGLSGSAGFGTNEAWEDITDEEGETWGIKNHATGIISFSPKLLFETYLTNHQGVGVGGRGQLRELTVAISYRYGGLGGSRGRAASTELDAQITDSETGSVAVTDGSGFPVGNSGGSIVVLVDREYMSVTPDPANDSMTIEERGVRGTSEAAHDSGARVQYTPPVVRKAVAARAAWWFVDSARYQKYLPDNEADIDKGELLDNLDSVWQTTVQAMS